MFSEHNNKQKGTFLSLFNYDPSTCTIGGAMNTEPGGFGETAIGAKTRVNGRRHGAQQHGERTISDDLFGYDMRNRYNCRQNKYNYGIYQMDRTL